VNRRHTVAVRRLIALLPVLAVLAACGGNDDDSHSQAPEASPTKSLFTLTAAPPPPKPPPTGKIIADILQASHDGARNRFQVWVDNDTDKTITPTKVTYLDDRFLTALHGTRLRDIPSQARRGFPIYLPDQPACDRTASRGTLTVEYTVGGEPKSTTIQVKDDADVIQRNTSARCLELSIDQIAHLSWADEVTASGDGGKGSVGTMTLVIDPTGRPGPTLVIDSIVGNPVLSPGELGVFNAKLTITGEQAPQRVPVPLRPTRCDAHAFGESGSFNAFAFNVRVDGKPGQFILRLSETGSANAVKYAKASCGFLTSIGGGEG
jgi:hypothetical protein